jgi:hypothetical protein
LGRAAGIVTLYPHHGLAHLSESVELGLFPCRGPYLSLAPPFFCSHTCIHIYIVSPNHTNPFLVGSLIPKTLPNPTVVAKGVSNLNAHSKPTRVLAIKAGALTMPDAEQVEFPHTAMGK